jgi:hypothetical protein
MKEKFSANVEVTVPTNVVCFFIYFQFSIFFLNFYLPFIFINKKRPEQKCHVVRRHWPLIVLWHITQVFFFFLYSFL